MAPALVAAAPPVNAPPAPASRRAPARTELVSFFPFYLEIFLFLYSNFFIVVLSVFVELLHEYRWFKHG